MRYAACWELHLAGLRVGVAEYSDEYGGVVFESIAGDCGPDVMVLGTEFE